MVDEERADVRQDEGEDARVLWRMWYVATVHKDVLASTVPMKVSEDQELTLFHKVMDHLFGVVDRWVEHFRWRLPSAI